MSLEAIQQIDTLFDTLASCRYLFLRWFKEKPRGKQQNNTCLGETPLFELSLCVNESAALFAGSWKGGPLIFWCSEILTRIWSGDFCLCRGWLCPHGVLRTRITMASCHSKRLKATCLIEIA